MNKKKVLFASVAVVVAAGLTWAFLPSAADRQVAKVVELQEKLFTENSNIPLQERRQAFEELRKEAEKLTPEQREQMMRDNPPPFARQMQQQVVAYFDLPADKQQAHLDKQIDEMEKRRAEWEKRRAERGKQGNGIRGGGGPRGGPPGGGFNRTDPSKQTEMRKKMLDNSTPQQRAMFSEYFQQLEDRRRERGLPAMRGPGGPRGI
ncbi:MAG: hypothetical protein WD669_00950 [Pirellulales bacterium]